MFLLGWVSSVICETLPAELIADVDEELPITSGGVFSQPTKNIPKIKIIRPERLNLRITKPQSKKDQYGLFLKWASDQPLTIVDT